MGSRLTGLDVLGFGASWEPAVSDVVHANTEICRVDVAASPTPVRARTSKEEQVFYVRLNNSTRALPEAEIEPYCAEHWSEP